VDGGEVDARGRVPVLLGAEPPMIAMRALDADMLFMALLLSS